MKRIKVRALARTFALKGALTLSLREGEQVISGV